MVQRGSVGKQMLRDGGERLRSGLLETDGKASAGSVSHGLVLNHPEFLTFVPGLGGLTSVACALLRGLFWVGLGFL